MKKISRTEARRADRIRAFREELERLEAERVLVLSAEQRESIAQHHGALLRDLGKPRRPMAARIGAFLGALALAATAYFLFDPYWASFPAPVQIAILLTGSFGSFIGAFWIARHDDAGHFARWAAILAFACFVANTVLFARIFNITSTAAVFIPWTAFAVLMAHTFRSKVLLAAGLLCAIAFVVAHAVPFGDGGWLLPGTRLEILLPAALLLFIAPSVLSGPHFHRFAAIYRTSGLLAFLVPGFIMAETGAGSYLPLIPDTLADFYRVVGLIVSGAAIGLGVRRDWPAVLNVGIFFFALHAAAMLYDPCCGTDKPSLYFFFMIGAIAVMLIVRVLRRRSVVRHEA